MPVCFLRRDQRETVWIEMGSHNQNVLYEKKKKTTTLNKRKKKIKDVNNLQFKEQKLLKIYKNSLENKDMC